MYLYFPNETITATISGNRMKGVSTFKGTDKKEEWLVEKFISENNSKSLSVSEQLALQQQSERRESENKSQFSLSEFQNNYFKPSPLTGTSISGTNPEGSVNYQNYSFIADSGEITFTFSLNASQESFASSVTIEVQDSKNNVVAEKFVVTNRGKTEQSSVSIKIPEKQALLLRIKLSGGGSYQVRLSGALILN